MRISDWSSDVCSSDLGDHASEDQEHKSGNQADRRGDDAGDLAGRKDANALDDHRFLPMPAGCRRSDSRPVRGQVQPRALDLAGRSKRSWLRSEEHTSELQSLMRISYAVFCLKKKKKNYYSIL